MAGTHRGPGMVGVISGLRARLARAYERARSRGVKDRRRSPRYPITWLVRLYVDDTKTIVARTVDVSLHGLCLALNDEAGALPLRPGERYRLEVMLPDSEGKFVRVGEVRYVGEAGVGFKIVEPLPDAAASVLSMLQGTIATPSRR